MEVTLGGIVGFGITGGRKINEDSCGPIIHVGGTFRFGGAASNDAMNQSSTTKFAVLGQLRHPDPLNTNIVRRP